MRKKTKARHMRDTQAARLKQSRITGKRDLTDARTRLNHIDLDLDGKVTVYNPTTDKRYTLTMQQYNKMIDTINMSDIETVKLGFAKSNIVGQFRRQSDSTSTKALPKFSKCKQAHVVKSSELDRF